MNYSRIISSGQVLIAVSLIFSQFTPLFGQKLDERPSARPITLTDLDHSDEGFQITEAGPHHRKWERVETFTNEFGEEEERLHSYTELGAGLNRWDEEKEEWTEASNVIEAFEGGAVARSGQTKVIFAPRLGDPEGTVDILTDEGDRIRTVVLGLSYFDPVSGDDVVLSEVNPDVMGEILPPNRVIYRNAFTDIDADVIYEYHRDRFSQNIVLHERPADPAAFGLSKFSRLEVLSEILEAPQPVKDVRVVKELAKDLNERSQMAEPDLIDETIRFTGSSIGKGKAFDLGDPLGTEAIVTKRWVEDGGRTVLFEGVEFEASKKALNKLPRLEGGGGRPRADVHRDRQKGLRTIPNRQLARTDSNRHSSIQIASMQVPEKAGYLIDYELVSGNTTDYVFETGKTYLISGRVYCYGRTVFEGGAVIKHNNSQLDTYGDVAFKTQPYLPVIFTSKHDDSVGEIVSGSTGVPPSSPYDSSALHLMGTTGQLVENVRVKYAQIGIYAFLGGGGHRWRNIQAVNCYIPLMAYGSPNLQIENVLLNGVYRGIENVAYSPLSAVLATQVTIHDGAHAFYGMGFELKNSLLVDCTNIPSYTGQGASHNVELSSASGVFQSAGGGHFYLANDSPYRDLGTSQIDPGLATELSGRTTFPPTVLAAGHELTENTQWSSHVAKDVGPPDIGYHYPLIDYLVDTCVVGSGVELRVNPGTVIVATSAVPSTSATHLALRDDSSLIMEGTLLEPVIFANDNVVHENSPGTIWASIGPSPADRYSTAFDTMEEVTLRFVNFYSIATRGSGGGILATQFSNGLGWITTKYVDVTDCQFFSFFTNLRPTWSNTMEFNRNTLVRGSFKIETNADLEFHNNHFSNLSTVWLKLSLWPQSGATYSIRENVFDVYWVNYDTNLYFEPFWEAASNAVIDYCCMALSSTDIRITGGFDFSPGPFGSFYQPNNGGNPLIDAGSRTGSVAGFYHHTSLDDETPELNSLIEIGLHYPAVGGDGRLLDTDGDGVANIFEDLDGDSVVDSNETDWQSSENGTTGVAGLQIFTRLE